MPITLTDRISYIPASHGPLSADVFMFRGDTATWLFDVGLNDASYAFIEALPGPKAAVLSHFHEDHTDNVKRLRLDALYGGKETVKHTGWGTVVDAPLTLEDGLTLTVFPLPSSHAKGALGLMTGDIAFLGDGTYCRVQFGRDMLQYNAQLLREQLRVLESLPVRYFALSHEPQLLRTKEEVLRELKALYALRRSDSPYIEVPREKPPRTLSLTVTEENAGRRVRSLIKAGFALSEAMLGTLKTADGSVRKNGESCRLEEVAKQILTTRLSMRKIATSCGFRSVSHLGVLFRRRYGTTLLGWRREHGAF